MRELQELTERRPFWPLDWMYIRGVFVKTVIFADDVKIRWLMALSSIGVGAELFIWPETIDRPYFHLVKMAGPAWLWALTFMLHGVGALWRIFERRERLNWAKAINGVGLAVWVAFAVAQEANSPQIAISTVLEGWACFFLFLTFVSTGFSSKSTTA